MWHRAIVALLILINLTALVTAMRLVGSGLSATLPASFDIPLEDRPGALLPTDCDWSLTIASKEIACWQRESDTMFASSWDDTTHIVRVTRRVSGVEVGQIIASWGQPQLRGGAGRQVYLQWGTKSVEITTDHLCPGDEVNFLIYDDGDMTAHAWTGFNDK